MRRLNRTVRRRVRIFLVLLAVASVTASTAQAATAHQRGTATPPEKPSPDAAMNNWVGATMRHMTLPDKVGQLFVAAVHGYAADQSDPANRQEFGVDTPAEVVRRYNVGGIVYFHNSHVDNIQNPWQVAALSNGLQRAALHSGAGVPLLVGTDQEEGSVTRIGAPATRFPGNMALGAGRSAHDARQAARITGTELRAMGVNQDYAPDADVNVNPANPVIGVRSFGANPQLVAALTAAQVTGYQHGPTPAETVIATAKHFPGHGDTNTDSHTGLPVIDHDRAEWERIDAPPFRAAIAAGVGAVMSAHIVMPGIDPSGEPATLSPTLLTGLLRDDLGYRGVIVTDSLQMEGVRLRHTDAEIPVLALLAGADQLLMPANLGLAIDSVLGAVRTGRLTERRIDESVQRILRLKWRYGVVADPLVDQNAVAGSVGTPDHLAAAQRITDATTTVLRNDAGLLPLRVKPRHVLVVAGDDQSADALAARIAARGPATSTTVLGSGAGSAAATASAARDADLVVILGSGLTAAQRTVACRLAAPGRPVVVAAASPYDTWCTGSVPTWVVTYSMAEVALESLVRVMFGEIRPVGRLPVDVPGDSSRAGYRFGHGMSW